MATKPKIALIGPMPPYRSGIAMYTVQLRNALRQFADIQTISFKRQYPKFLYPGGSDIPDDAKDSWEPDVDYLIDVYNPLTWRKATDEIIKSGCDLAILDWWTLFWQPGFAYIARRLRKHGVKTMFLCHNLLDHDNARLTKLSEKLLKQADSYMVQSAEQEQSLLQMRPDARFIRRIHPIRRDPIPATKKLPKRGRLELLFFGLIRPYKGLETLLVAAEQLHDKDIYLTVAGEPWGDKEVLKNRLATAKIPNLETHLEYVSDEQAAAYFNRADAVVLPYLSATGSGVIASAYAYDKPVITTAVGGLVDAVVEGKTGWLVPPDSPEALAVAIKKADRKQLAATKLAIDKFCEQNSWQAMAETILDFAGKL